LLRTFETIFTFEEKIAILTIADSAIVRPINSCS